MPVAGIQNLLDPGGAVPVVPLIGQEPAIFRVDHAVVRIDDPAAGRVEGLGQFLERDAAGPGVLVRPAGYRYAAVSLAANRHQSGWVEADIALHVGIDDIL